MGLALLSGLVLLHCGPVVLLHLPLRERMPPQKSIPVAEAIQKLQEVFNIGDLPHNTLPVKKPPQFMLELYSQVADPDGSTRAPGLLQGNVVRSFENKVYPEQEQPVLFFNISSIGSNERMLKAELRVFKQKPLHVAPRQHFCRMDLYELLESRSRPWRGNLISSRLLSLHSQGWEMFNVTQTVSRWVGDDGANHGFLVTSTLPSGNFLETDFLFNTKQQPHNKRSYLVLFSDDRRRGDFDSITPPHMQDIGVHIQPESPVLPPAIPKFPLIIELKKSRKIRELIDAGYPLCQRKPLYVDFEEIGWAGVIISPKAYNAYHCKGACFFPLGQGLGATNHATVQSIVHVLKLQKDISNPCCVPNKLNSINLLYFDDEENVVLKQYDDMVAASCGCH